MWMWFLSPPFFVSGTLGCERRVARLVAGGGWVGSGGAFHSLSRTLQDPLEAQGENLSLFHARDTGNQSRSLSLQARILGFVHAIQVKGSAHRQMVENSSNSNIEQNIRPYHSASSKRTAARSPSGAGPAMGSVNTPASQPVRSPAHCFRQWCICAAKGLTPKETSGLEWAAKDCVRPARQRF